MGAMFRGLDSDKYDRQYSDAYLFRRIFTYFSAFKREVAVIIAGFSVFAIIVALQPVIISQVVEELARQNPMYTIMHDTPLARDLAAFPLLRASTMSENIMILIGALVISAFLFYTVNWARRYLSSKVIGNVVANMRKDAFSAAVDRDLAFYDKNKSGKIVSRITSDTQDFSEVSIIAMDIFSQIIAVLTLLFALFRSSLQLTLIMLVTMPVFFVASVIFRNMARNVTRQGSRAMAIVNDNIQESVTGISVAKNFRKEALMYEEFDRVNNQSYRINMRRGLVLVLVFPVMNIISGFAIAIVLYSGASLAVVGTVTIGAWYLFIQGIDRFWFPMIQLASFWSQFQQALSSTERIFALIDADNTIKQDAEEHVESLRGRIEVDNVTFEYEPGEPVLEDFNLTIEPGESIAFVGHTGAGKSTIAKLISRFYEFQNGEIRIDGRDIRSFDLQSYRSKLGIVPQQPFLFSGTIIDNIRYSRPDATDEEIREIAMSIGEGEWLETLPDGLYSDVGERGARLSMGQRQLVSLVRVLLQKPAIFVLDEATASVDPFTETQIQEALDMILAQSTSILIAHRLSTVRSADRIIVLENGGIIEEGDHDALMQQGGHYAELYNTYFRHQSLSYIENARDLMREQLAGD